MSQDTVPQFQSPGAFRKRHKKGTTVNNKIEKLAGEPNTDIEQILTKQAKVFETLTADLNLMVS
jgi:hypothetical protein